MSSKWYACGETKDSTNAAIFAKYLLEQLQYYGVNINETIIQTDNGSEFIGSVLKKKGKSAFVKVLESSGVKHARISPRACTWSQTL